MDRFISMVAVAFFAAVMLQNAGAQTEHVVGDSLGWAIPPNGAAAYTNWASTKTFTVGDFLIFNFGTNQHDVVKVPKESYDSCSKDNSIGDTITEGPANITLGSAGDHYYICTIGHHCQAGQKLSITVSATPGGSAAPCPSSGPTASTPPAPGSSSSAVFASFSLTFLAAVMGFLL